MAIIQCPSCGKDLVVESLARLPPWCSKCGADLKPGAATPARAPISPAGGATLAPAPAVPPTEHLACGQCGKAIAPDNTGRLPPWCPKCGADLKPIPGPVKDTSALPVPVAAPLTPQQALEEAINRAKHRKPSMKTLPRTKQRMGLGLVLGGLGLLTLAAAFSWLLSDEEGIYVPTGLLLVGGMVTVGGLLAMMLTAAPDSAQSASTSSPGDALFDN